MINTTILQFERITVRHHVDNIASECVMKKCWLKYEGTLRKIHKVNTGMLVDCKYYSIGCMKMRYFNDKRKICGSFYSKDLQ